MTDGVTIDELVLRLAGIDEERAQRVAREVGSALHDRLRIAGITGHVSLARVHVRIPDDVPLERLPTVIADRIWEAIA